MRAQGKIDTHVRPIYRKLDEFSKNGLNKNLRKQLIFYFVTKMGQKIINGDVEALTRKSHAHFQVV